MADDARRLHERNRAAWNEAAVRYAELIERDVARLRRRESTLHRLEREQLGDLHGRCRLAVHLQCASGSDSLSLHLLGANEVAGIDISDRHIANARRKSTALGWPARWYRTDVLDPPDELIGTADLVYTGRGAINWIHDLAGWAGTVARLLAPGGRFYLFEAHPLVWLWQEAADTFVINPRYSYFQTAADASQGWPAVYLGKLAQPDHEQAVKYERLWPPSAVINALITAGLQLDRFTEHPDEPYSFSLLPNIPADIRALVPQSYAVQAHRG